MALKHSRQVAITQSYCKRPLGCDSTVNLALTVNPIQTTNVSQTICEGKV
ncbi:MAG: hypothetical protein R2807_05705 [Chitinophagales bacterium]